MKISSRDSTSLRFVKQFLSRHALDSEFSLLCNFHEARSRARSLLLQAQRHESERGKHENFSACAFLTLNFYASELAGLPNIFDSVVVQHSLRQGVCLKTRSSRSRFLNCFILWQ